MVEKVGVVGLGYVGLPVALAFARHFSGALGFDIDDQRLDPPCVREWKGNAYELQRTR